MIRLEDCTLRAAAVTLERGATALRGDIVHWGGEPRVVRCVDQARGVVMVDPASRLDIVRYRIRRRIRSLWARIRNH